MFAYVILVGGVVFWPTLIIAIVQLRAPLRAFALAASFTLGAMLGSWVSLLAAQPLFAAQSGDARTYYMFGFAALGAIAGGLIAVFLLSKIAGPSLWRRS
jgi:hypothetical protein